MFVLGVNPSDRFRHLILVPWDPIGVLWHGLFLEIIVSPKKTDLLMPIRNWLTAKIDSRTDLGK